MVRRDLGAILFLVLILCVLAAVLFSPLGDWLTLEKLKESRVWLARLVDSRPLLSAGLFFLFCLVATAACFPAAPILGVTGGALFGFWPGLGLVLLASAIGSTIAFLDSRYLLRELVRRRFRRRIDRIDRGIERHGALYLLTLRFNPVIPYWLVNLTMGLTAMRLRDYAPLTLLGLLPATLVYVTAGTQLATIDSAADILSPGLLVVLMLLSLFPLIAAAAASLMPRRRA